MTGGFRPHLDRFPERSAAAVSAIAAAEPGGVAFHCHGGLTDADVAGLRRRLVREHSACP